MTLEELRRLRQACNGRVVVSPEILAPVFDLAEAMLKIKAVSVETEGIVGIYRSDWKEEPGWVADCDINAQTLADCASDDLLEAIDDLHDTITT